MAVSRFALRDLSRFVRLSPIVPAALLRRNSSFLRMRSFPCNFTASKTAAATFTAVLCAQIAVAIRVCEARFSTLVGYASVVLELIHVKHASPFKTLCEIFAEVRGCASSPEEYPFHSTVQLNSILPLNDLRVNVVHPVEVHNRACAVGRPTMQVMIDSLFDAL